MICLCVFFFVILNRLQLAPEYQPLAALHMIKRFISSQSLADPSQSAKKYAHEFQRAKITKQGDVLRAMQRRNGAM